MKQPTLAREKKRQMTTIQQASYQLRDYQEALIQTTLAHWRSGARRVMLQLPTAAGKTVIFSAIAREFTARGEGVLVLAHREELLLQAQEKLTAVTGQPVGIIKASHRADSSLLIQVASVQTLSRRRHLPDAALVITDEAHHAAARSYTKIFDHYSSAYNLGVTATPARIDGQGFKFLYDALVLGPSVSELIAAGHLCRFKLFAAKNIIKTAGLRITGGDFNQRDLTAAIDTSLVMGDLITTWRQYASGKKTVVFAVNVAHSQAITAAYLEAGIPAEHLDGDTPASHRAAILTRFRSGRTLILSNCGIISEGFDVPDIEAIQCVRPTKSLILWLQMVGRALRPAPGKDHAILIDHTQNWIFHGLPDEERSWSLEPVSLSSHAWALECPACQHVFKPLPHEQKRRLASCPNCTAMIQFEIGIEGQVLPPRIINLDVETAQLEEIDLECNPIILQKLYEIKEIQEQQEFKKSWVYRTLLERCPNVGLPELRVCAKLLGYKAGWAWYRWLEIQQRRAPGAA